MKRGVVLAVGLVLGAPAQAADEKGRASDRALAPLVACRTVADVRARALCYDNALDKLQQSVAERNVVVVDREQVKTNFGFNTGQLIAPRAAAAPTARVVEEELVINSTIAAVGATGYDLWNIRLANGATWRTTDTDIGVVPRVGADVQIRRGALGSYFMRVGKARAIRVRRIN